MPSDTSGKTVCVLDHGVFGPEFARTLSKSFDRTLLVVPWEVTMPSSATLMIGEGLPNVEKVDAIWPYLSQIDLFVFPDVHQGPLQEYLVSMGKRVWGSRMGEELEVFRDYSKRVFEQHGAAIAPYQVLHGLAALRKHLERTEKPQYVKVNRARGDCETFRAESYDLCKPRLDDLAYTLGPRQATIEFIVEDEIPDAVEVAIDTYCVDGKFPARSLVGIETKDKGYVAVMQEWGDMPEPLRELYAIAAPLLRSYQYRNFWAMEARITKDGTPWLIDPCARCGAPPHEVQLLEYTNLAEILWHGADGEMVDPEPAGAWACQVMLRSDAPPDAWQVVKVPKAVDDAVKLHFRCRIDGEDYITPAGVSQGIVGAVVACGDTLDQTTEAVTEAAKELKGCYLDAPLHALDDAASEIEHLREFGIHLDPSVTTAPA